MNEWYRACNKAASIIRNAIPGTYRSRTFSGIIGDIKALPSKKALSLISRKKGLGKQYAYLYLTRGIDEGRGYQACTTEALASALGNKRKVFIKGNILDVGCAVGVTAGILNLCHVTGFDLFTDLLQTAKLIDSLLNRENDYVAADMTKTWPFDTIFDTVVCGLVCHHLKTQSETASFFSNVNRVLKPYGSLIITMPSGSISNISNFNKVTNTIKDFGFKINSECSGIVLSDDSTHSLFWMFLITAEKVSDEVGSIFISPDFAFPLYRTPVTREEKGKQARETVQKTRMVRHEYFKFINAVDLEKRVSNRTLVYETVSKL